MPDDHVVKHILRENEKLIFDEDRGIVKPDPNFRNCIGVRDYPQDTAEQVNFDIF